MLPDLCKTYHLMLEAHRGATDLHGAPYWMHPLRVLMRLPVPAPEAALHVALLHDAVEDGGLTLADLIAKGYPLEVTDAVDLLTRPKGMTYADYITRIKTSGNAIAVMVKLADLGDNTDPKRGLPPKAKLIKRYIAAKAALGVV